MANHHLGTFCLENILTNRDLEELQEDEMPDGQPSFYLGIEVRRYERETYNSDIVYGFLRPHKINPKESRGPLVNVLIASDFHEPTEVTGQFMKIDRRHADPERRLRNACEDFYGLLALLRQVVRRNIGYKCLGFMDVDLATRPTSQGAGSVLFTATVVFAHPSIINLSGGDLPQELLDFAIQLRDPGEEDDDDEVELTAEEAENARKNETNIMLAHLTKLVKKKDAKITQKLKHVGRYSFLGDKN